MANYVCVVLWQMEENVQHLFVIDRNEYSQVTLACIKGLYIIGIIIGRNI